jgi:aldose 1-epimerase
MKFSVNIKNEDIFSVVILKDEQQKTEAVIYTFGGLLNNFIIDGQQNIVDGFTSYSDAKKNITDGFKSCKLNPFVCRVNNGEYEFQNEKYKTGKFFIGAEAIHGLLYDAVYDIIDSGADNSCAFVKLQYVYSKKDEGFLFEYSCEITYRLEEENKLSISTTIVNKSNKEMPLSDGWHPYFKFDQSINNLSLKINAAQILEFDKKLLPTGKILPFSEFQTLEKLNDKVFDNCFLLNNTTEPGCIIEDIQNKLRLKISPLENYPYLQVYTPPHRKSIAIENLSSAPDAFNNKIGLITLQPSESKTFTTTFQAEYY